MLWQKLQEELAAVDKGLDGVMGLAVKDLTSGETFFIHGDEIMPQASSIKIAVLADLYLQAQQGKLKLTDEYVVRSEDLVSRQRHHAGSHAGSNAPDAPRSGHNDGGRE